MFKFYENIFLLQFESDFEQVFPDQCTLFVDNWQKSGDFLISKLRVVKISDAADYGLLHIISTVNSGIKLSHSYNIL